MIGIVIAAHGAWAASCLQTAQMVVGEGQIAIALGIEAQDDSASFAARLKAAVATMLGHNDSHGVLVLTDMFGGSPSNVGLTLHQPGSVEIVTGANLPMLIKALQICPKAADLSQVARLVKEAGIRAIAIASEVLHPNQSQREE